MSGVEPPLSVALAGDSLALQWADRLATIAAATLRAHCRCASCRSACLRGDALALSADASTLVDALPVGHYALQLRFADGHDRGIFPWPALRALGTVA
jgi:DUF971 family protein